MTKKYAPGFKPNPDGKSRRGYEYQAAPLKWRCWHCMNLQKWDIKNGEKKPRGEYQATSRAQMVAHVEEKHPEVPTEQPTRNRLHRVATIQKALGL